MGNIIKFKQKTVAKNVKIAKKKKAQIYTLSDDRPEYLKHEEVYNQLLSKYKSYNDEKILHLRNIMNPMVKSHHKFPPKDQDFNKNFTALLKCWKFICKENRIRKGSNESHD